MTVEETSTGELVLEAIRNGLDMGVTELRIYIHLMSGRSLSHYAMLAVLNQLKRKGLIP